MGVWGFINSTTETVKRNAPDLTPVKNACSATYGYGSAAFWKIDNAVRVNCIQNLKYYMPDEKGRAQISFFASKFAQNAAEYALRDAYKMVPGGKAVEAVGKIVSQTVRDVKSENRNNQELDAVKEVNTSSGRNVLDRAEMKGEGLQVGYQNGISADFVANQTPEDVLRIFMMKEFIGTRFLDDLIIPQKRHGKEAK